MILRAIVAAALLPSVATAGGHKRAIVVKPKPIIVQQLGVPLTYYDVGASLKEEAIAERVYSRVEARLDAYFAALVAHGADTSGATQQHEVGPSLLAHRCATCHDPNSHKHEKLASEALTISPLKPLSCEERLEAINAAVTGRMPPGGELAPEELGEFIELLSSQNEGE